MASQQLDNSSMEVHQKITDNNQDDVVSIDLPAPEGWTKKFIPKKGGTPRRNEIVFIAPTGEEIKTKRQLDQYLKSHLGGPSAAEFDWGTGDSPRRSSRLSSKPKAAETPESGSSRKKQRRSNSKKVEEKKEDTDGEGASAEDEVTADKTGKEKDVEMKDAEVAGNHPQEGKPEGTHIAANSAKVFGDTPKGTDDETKHQEADSSVEVAANHPQEGKAEEVQIAANSTEASVNNSKGNDGETKQQEADSSVTDFCGGKEPQPEEKRPEGAPEQVDVQAPHETAPDIKQAEPDGKAIHDPSEVGVPEIFKAVEDQPAENEEEPAKELPGAQVQPEAAPVNEVQSVDEEPAADAEIGIDNSDQGKKDLEVSSEEVNLDGNNIKENQEAANNINNEPVNADNVEPSTAPPVTC